MEKYKAHLFICTNDRGPDGKASCARRGSQKLRDEVKAMCKAKGIEGVRVNNAGCLGPCERGISAVIYPQAQWHLDLKADQGPLLVEALEQALKG